MATDTDAPVKERSVPKPVFTDAEAGAQGVPLLDEPQLQLLHAGQAPGDGLRGRDRRRPARSRAPPAPGLDLWLRRRDRRLPAGVDGAEVVQLAPVPRSQRGVGADDLPQQRQRRAADQPEPRQRQGGPRLRRVEPRLDQGGRAPRRRVGPRRARHRHARLPAGPARRPDQHDQQRAVGGLGAQAALRPGPDPLQPRAVGDDRGLRRPGAQAGLERGPDLAGRPRERRGHHRHP